MSNLPQLSPRQLARYNEAVEWLVHYILGCQPAVVAANDNSRMTHDPTEPDNMGWYGYDRALGLLGRTVRSRVERHRLWQQATDEAWSRAEILAHIAGYSLPLRRPVRL